MSTPEPRVLRVPFSTNVERVALAAAHKGVVIEWVGRATAGLKADRPAGGGPIECFWEEVHLRGTFAGSVSASFLNAR